MQRMHGIQRFSRTLALCSIHFPSHMTSIVRSSHLIRGAGEAIVKRSGRRHYASLQHDEQRRARDVSGDKRRQIIKTKVNYGKCALRPVFFSFFSASSLLSKTAETAGAGEERRGPGPAPRLTVPGARPALSCRVSSSCLSPHQAEGRERRPRTRSQ